MHKVDPAITTIALAGVVAIAAGIGAGSWSTQTAEHSLIATSAHAQATSTAATSAAHHGARRTQIW